MDEILFDRLKAVKNHLLLTLEEVKAVQAEQFNRDESRYETVLASDRSILEQLESIRQIVLELDQAIFSEVKKKGAEPLIEKIEHLLAAVGSVKSRHDSVMAHVQHLNQKIDQLMSEIAPSTSRHDLMMMHVQPLNQKADQLKNEVVAIAHWMQQIEIKLEQQVDSQRQLKKALEPFRENFSSASAQQNYLLANPEVGLLMHLRSVLPNNVAIDIGANRGDVSEALLACGYEVFAFEPLPEVCVHLIGRLESYKGFHALPVAVGAINEHRNIRTVVVDSKIEHLFESNLTVYAGLVEHALPEGMHYDQSVDVTVKNLRTLHAEGILPVKVAVLKIDTEGNDLAVIEGMGDIRYSVVMCEFWDASHFFSNGQFGLLNPIVLAMRERGYRWHIVIYRVCTPSSSSEPRFFCNFDNSVENSWGNVVFFRNFDEFKAAHNWCQETLREVHVFA